MATISRICTHCNKSSALDAQHCQHCGHSMSTHPDAYVNMPQTTPTSLSESLRQTATKAALPILAGAAGWLVRKAWQLLRERMDASTALDSFPQTQTAKRTPDNNTHMAQTHTPRRTIHIRSKWMVSDANGVWQQGASEHTIELD
ncbi:MAG: hypothetical protein AAF639_31855 [Chloroflexota bacterium]